MTTLADRLRETAADLTDDAPMPVDPFEATDILDACRDLGRAVVTYAAEVRAHRAAMAPAWAAFEASLDKTGQTPPPPPPDEDPPPADPAPSEPPSDRGGI